MQPFVTAFILALLNSLWQAAILYLFYKLANKLWLKRLVPLARKNLLLLLVTGQIVIFIITFSMYVSGNSNGLPGSIDLSSIQNSSYFNIMLNGIVIIYSIVFVYKLSAIIYHWYYYRNIFSAGLLKPGIDLRLFTRHTSSMLGIKRKVEVWFSNQISSPATFGFLKPVILLPVSLVNQLTMQQAETIILHELSHIKANDFFINWIVLFAETLFWCNPFVKTICKEYRLEREKTCDYNVLCFNYPALVYAESLLASAGAKSKAPVLFAAAGKEALYNRIKSFTLDTPYKRSRPASLAAACMLGCLSICLCFTTLTFKKQHLPINETDILAPIISIKAPGLVAHTKPDAVTKINNQPAAKADEAKKIMATPIAEKVLINEPVAGLPANYNLVSVANPETIVQNEVLVEEEVSGTKTKTLSVYKLKFDGTNWVLEPVVNIKAKEKTTDSSTKPGPDTKQQGW